MTDWKDTDLQTLRDIIRWHRQGMRVLLATVVHSYGSSPRPAGSMAAFGALGVISGAVSGGCVEDDICQKFCAGTLSRTEVMRYGGTEAVRLGLPCGGTLEVLVEPDPDIPALELLCSRLERRQLTFRRVDLHTGSTEVGPGTPGDSTHYDGRSFRSIHGPSWRLLLIGANSVAAALCPLALSLGYDTLVCDPRPEYGQDWGLADIPLRREMPDDLVRALVPDQRTAIIALAHDPKIDDLALMESLESPAFYVGALGSTANNMRRRQRLGALGVRDTALARLHGPVGLAIGSRTPAEIAIAIAADLIQERSRLTILPLQPVSAAELTHAHL